MIKEAFNHTIKQSHDKYLIGFEPSDKRKELSDYEPDLCNYVLHKSMLERKQRMQRMQRSKENKKQNESK